MFDKTFFIENIGTANLIITDLYISGINMDDFDIIDNTTSPITPQESTSFTIRFDPLTIGNKSAIVTINNNDTNEGVFTFTVSGTGKWQQQAKLLASDGEPDDGFGSSVSISGNYAIVGSPHNNNSIGIAYIYYWDGLNWIEQTKLSDINGESIDQFGGSVDIFGNYAIVGVPMDISFSGSAYIYNWNGLNWVEQAKLTARFDNYDVMEFGCSVSISGNYIIVGAAGDDIYTGSAYIYYWDGLDWIEQAKLTASDRDDSDCFGTVDISGDYAIVGAFNAYNGGSAYIFYRNGSIWEEQAKLKASDGEPGDHFGRSVSISGDYAIVGARHDDDNGNNSGSAYIFYSNGLNWVEQAKLLASDGGPDDYFGTSVNISGDYAIIGAEGNGYYNSGNAYIFHNNEITWEEELKIIANDGIASDYFVCSVSISENYAIVGARYDDDNGMDSGSAYIFINQ